MKKHMLTLAFALLSLVILAQNTEKKAVFNVVKPGNEFAVSASKMNVFYIGVDNPIDIAICGIPTKCITATIDSGTIQKVSDGKFIVRIKGGFNETKIHVFACTNGKRIKIGERIFRIKRVPDPIPTIAGIKSGNIQKSLLMAAPGIIPTMENFDFDLNFTIVSFTFLMKVGTDILPITVSGNTFTQSIKNLISRAIPGIRVYFEDITAIGPDGTSRKLSPIILKLI